jgi:GntR family transcriptional regulator
MLSPLQPVTPANTKRLNALRPNGDDPTPLYLQVARRLADAINSGQWQAEEALPPERELSERLGISRVTARKALDVLVDQKLIHRRQGSGTFIATHIEEPLSRLTNFTELLKRKGFESSSRWVERKVDAPTYDEVLKLGVSPASQVARLERVRLADGVVMALERSTLPISILPDPTSVETSLYAHLDARGHSVVRALQHFRAVNASKRIARLVGINPGDAILLVTRIGFTKANVAIELTDTFCRNDYYDFVAELRR